jgi:hypothetical protein
VAKRTLHEVRAELREWLYDMRALKDISGTGFDEAYRAARIKGSAVAREYARLVAESDKDGGE